MFNLVTSDMTELGGLWAGGKHPRVNGSDSTSQQQRRGCSEIEELSRHDTHTQPRNLFFFFFFGGVPACVSLWQDVFVSGNEEL